MGLHNHSFDLVCHFLPHDIAQPIKTIIHPRRQCRPIVLNTKFNQNSAAIVITRKGEFALELLGFCIETPLFFADNSGRS
jgi:hypothetical protein